MASTRTARAFGQVLKEARKAAELSQEELALKARVSRYYVGLLESGKKNATLDVVVRMTKVLKIPLGTFMTEVERKMTKS